MRTNKVATHTNEYQTAGFFFKGLGDAWLATQ